MFDLAASLGEDRKARLRDAAGKGPQGLKTLKTLYEWVLSVVCETEDLTHEAGRAHHVGARDQAQGLRDALLPAIASAKSQAAYDTLEDLRRKADGNRAMYIRHLQFNMREDEAATPPLPQRNYGKFEHDFASPVTDYVSFAQTVHNDLLAVKRSVEQGEFSLRRFFNTLTSEHVKTEAEGLALEDDFQALLGSELNHASVGRYGVTLEPILPDSTRRDVLCQIGTFEPPSSSRCRYVGRSKTTWWPSSTSCGAVYAVGKLEDWVLRRSVAEGAAMEAIEWRNRGLPWAS